MPSISRRSLLGATAAIAAAAILPGRAAAADSHLDLAIDWTLKQLSLEERVAQLFVFSAWGQGMSQAFQQSLATVKPGGVILMGNNIGSLDQVAQFASEIHASNPALPPLIAVDEEGGTVVRLPGDPVAGASALGQLSNDDVIAQSKVRARFLSDLGLDVNYAPVADVAYRADSVMAWRSFGADPATVGHKVSAFVKGSRQIGVFGAAKHFPGHGRTTVDSHYSVPVVDISYDHWLKSDAVPFKSAIRAGVELVMVGHLVYSQWDSAPASISKPAIQALRDGLGFDGLIVTDDLGMGALAGMGPFDVLDRAAAAGIDLFLYAAPPAGWADLVQHLVDRVRKGTVSERRINRSVRRLIELKYRRFELLDRIKG